MYIFEPISASDIQKKLSANCRARRLEKNMSQKMLSVVSGVPLSTVQRFEHIGEISLASFVKIGRALGYAEELTALMDQPKYDTIDDMVRINKNKERKRGTDEKN
ncbi:MAG: helix-turn-helix transcriptional regulator [Porphyromonas sp.]|nr:helix-turn-helix transcriptional regulator [Porphyromonas sp.]